MTPDTHRAKLEAILARLQANRSRLGRPGTAAPAEPAAAVEPETSPLYRTSRPAPAVVPEPARAPAVAPPRVAAVPARPVVEPARAAALPSRPVAEPAPVPAPPRAPAAPVAPPPPPVEAPMTWEGEDEEEMIVEEAPAVIELDEAITTEDAGVVTPAPLPAVESPPPRPAPLPSITVSPTATPVATPAAAPPVDVVVRASRIDAVPPENAAVVRSAGTLPPATPRTIGELLGAALRLLETR